MEELINETCERVAKLFPEEIDVWATNETIEEELKLFDRMHERLNMAYEKAVEKRKERLKENRKYLVCLG